MENNFVIEDEIKGKNFRFQKSKSNRVMSIDIIRGFTILVMIFVNDLAGVANVPTWMKHAPTMHDGMTFVDWVFPGFLFIVGMSIPFSIGRRIEKGENRLSIWKHILIRVAGLLLLGFFMVNGDRISDSGIFNPHLWIILMYIFIIIIWNMRNTHNNLLSKKWIRYIAAVGLLVLFFSFSGEQQSGLIQMRPYWWGILGLIGWAYLGACLFYILFRKNLPALIGSAVLLFCFYFADNTGMMNISPIVKTIWSNMYLGYILGSHTAIVILGVILGIKIHDYIDLPDHTALLRWAFGFGIFLLISGLLLHQLNKLDKMFIISKNLATVPWCLLSSAFTIWLWMIVYWFVDMKKHGPWFKILEPAGTNPLFAYILAPLVVELFALSSLAFNRFDIYSLLNETFYSGLIRAVLIALLMTWLAGFLSKKGIQLKL